MNKIFSLKHTQTEKIGTSQLKDTGKKQWPLTECYEVVTRKTEKEQSKVFKQSILGVRLKIEFQVRKAATIF